jgi:uncharacterized membrane protein (DUF4010 family)
VKYFGLRRGLLLAAAAGGLASSTAVTITNARHAAAGEGAPRPLAAGVAIASAVMFLRVAGIVAVLKPELLVLVAPALLAAALAALGFAVAWMAAGKTGDKYRSGGFRNPFDLFSVVGFAVFLGAIIVLSRAVAEAFGAAGAIAGAIIVGLADVDAVTVWMLHLRPGNLSRGEAVSAILAAVASDTVSKVAIGALIGRGWFAADLAAMAVGSLAAGGVAVWLTFLFVAD